MKLKITATRERVVIETATFELDVPEFLAGKVQEDERDKDVRHHIGTRPVPLAKTLAGEALKDCADTLEWRSDDAVEMRNVGVESYAIIKEPKAAAA